MRAINRNSFLAELSKLLTFMFEEDRRQALDMYADMFDKTTNESGLISLLMSPTRQAVLIAREYDSKNRLDGAALGKGSSAKKADPGFVEVINNMRSSAEDAGLFSALPEEDDAQAEIPENISSEEEAGVAETQPEEISEGKQPDAPDTAEEEPNDALEEPEEREEEQESEIVDLSEDTDAQPPVAVEETDTADIIPAAETGNDDDDDEEPERKAMVGWLVLFVMLAIPIGLAAAVILIVAAVAFLAVAAATVVTGIYAVKAAFSGFAIFADMLLSLSVAVAILALGLLFIWTAIWLLSGAVPDVIKGIIKLGRKWCYKEVEE